MSTHTTVRTRKLVGQMPEYHPPLAGRTALRLDFNENTLSPSPRVLARLQEISAEQLTIYPEREPVERIVAKKFSLASNEVILTNGVDEAIHLLACAFLEPEDEAIIAVPSFFMYDVSLSMMTTRLVRVQAGEDLQFPFAGIMRAITPCTKIIVIASPNNPTGAVVHRAQVLEIAAAAPHALLFIDEAYYHFHGESVLEEVPRVTNLIIGRTFSKAYGMASLRIGVLAGHAELITAVRKVSSPYNVNGVALECLRAALEDNDYIAWYAEQIRTGRERMELELTQLGVPFWPSHANFILMKIGAKHKELVAAIRNRGILLRDRSTDPGCDGCVRITIGIAKQVDRGAAALRESLAEIGWTKEEAEAWRPNQKPKAHSEEI